MCKSSVSKIYVIAFQLSSLVWLELFLNKNEPGISKRTGHLFFRDQIGILGDYVEYFRFFVYHTDHSLIGLKKNTSLSGLALKIRLLALFAKESSAGFRFPTVNVMPAWLTKVFDHGLAVRAGVKSITFTDRRF